MMTSMIVTTSTRRRNDASSQSFPSFQEEQKPRLKPQAKRARLDALKALKRKLKARG